MLEGVGPAGTNAGKKGVINMSDIFIFICGAVIAIVFFMLGTLFGTTLRSQNRRIIISLPDDFALEDVAAETEPERGGR